MNADLSAWMAFTGPDKEGGQEWDALDVVKVKFVLADPGTAPTAANDTATTDAGKPVTIAVLANDKGTGLTIPSVTTPANGTAADQHRQDDHLHAAMPASRAATASATRSRMATTAPPVPR